MRYVIAAVLVILAALTAVVAEETIPVSDAKPTLDDLGWLTGSWNGEGLGGEIEEHWTAASGGTMLGAFRLVVEGKLGVIEYLMITEEAERIAYRFKHFRADYTTWESDRPLEFTLIRVSEREAVFHSDVPDQNAPRRLTYRLSDEGVLSVVVAGSDDQGQLNEGFEVRFTRDGHELPAESAAGRSD
jgi:hypothetical protein